jgi:hypothetical protein
MLLFRSEEELQTWCTARGTVRGAILTLPHVWALSQVWYGNRLSPDYRGRSLEEIRAIFTSQDMIGDFWQGSA